MLSTSVGIYFKIVKRAMVYTAAIQTLIVSPVIKKYACFNHRSMRPKYKRQTHVWGLLS